MTQISDKNLPKNAVIHSSPGVGKFSTETLKAYEESDALKNMFTTLVIHSENLVGKSLLKIFPFLKAKFKNRYFSEIPLKKIKLYPYKEICRLLAVKFLSLTTADTVWEWAELSFDKWVSKRLNKDIKIVHCYEHAALFTFKSANKFGCFKILEQVSQHHIHYSKTVSEQFELYPNLRSKYNEKISHINVEQRNKRKDDEYDLADLIICNSTFTMKTLMEAGIVKKKIVKIPLAFPEVLKVNKHQLEKFTFIYVGSLSLTKGTHILLQAWRKYFSTLLNTQLILAGSSSLPEEFTENLPKNIELKGFLDKQDLNNLYNQADLLVFPTLGDGFGMVITEAMAKGLPVLTTNNSAGYDLIDDCKDGFIVDAGNVDALAEKMLWIVKNRSILEDMSKLIMDKARKYQWSDYRKLLIAEVEKRYLAFNSDKSTI